MIDKIMEMGRPVAFGLAGVAAGMLLGKSKKQKNQMALGYGTVGAIVGYASDKMQTEEVTEAVEAAAEAEAAAVEGFGALHYAGHGMHHFSGHGMHHYGAPAATPAATAAAPIAAAAAAIPQGSTATTTVPSTLPSASQRIPLKLRKRLRRNFRVLPGRRVLPYRRLSTPIPSYRPAFRKPIAPRRIFRARGRTPYRVIRPRVVHNYYNVMRPYAPRLQYPSTPGYSVRRGRNYFGPATTKACRLLLAKIQRMQKRIDLGLPTFKRPGVPLSEVEAPIYLAKLKKAYVQYCGQLGLYQAQGYAY